MDEIRVKVINAAVDPSQWIERTVTRKAYMALGPKVYQRLSPTEETQSEGSPNSTGPQVSRSVKVAGPVVSEQIQAENTDAQPEPNPTFKLSDQKVTEVKTKAKPGPKPKLKSISSNSSANEK